MIIQIIFLIVVSIFSGLLAFNNAIKARVNVNSFLSFSGAYLLSICLLHLLPDFFQENDSTYSIYILVGYFLQLILDYFSGGIEHGHTHVNHKKLGQYPLLIIVSLCIHAFLEAIPIHHIQNDHHHSTYYLGILVHKAPIAFVFTALLIAYKLSRKTVFTLLIVFSLVAPLGIWLGSYFEQYSNIFQILYAISIGIILHLSTTILLESNEEHKIKWKKITPLFLGAILALLGQLIH